MFRAASKEKKSGAQTELRGARGVQKPSKRVCKAQTLSKPVADFSSSQIAKVEYKNLTKVSLTRRLRVVLSESFLRKLSYELLTFLELLTRVTY